MLDVNELMLFNEKINVSERMDDSEQIIFRKYFYDLIISSQISRLDHQTFDFKVTFIQNVDIPTLLISFFSPQPILWLMLLFPKLFSLPILLRVSLPLLFLKPLLIFIFLKLQPVH